jgi:hypothetical protein
MAVSHTEDMNLRLKHHNGKRQVMVVEEGGNEVPLEDRIASIFHFPSDKEFDDQISGFKEGEDKDIVRDVGKHSVSLYSCGNC